MNPKLTLQLLTLAIALLLAGCGQEKEPVAVTGVALSQASLTLTEGDTQTLSATVQPSNADNKSVSWSSSNASVASVQDGLVTAHQAGSATITVKTADGGKTATCSVTVTAKVVAVAGVSLDKTSLELTEGEEVTLKATVTPDNASNKNVTWTSSNPEVATVENGKVTAVKAGTTTITVTTVDGAKTAKCEVTVLYGKPNEAIIFADEIMKGMCVKAFDTNGDGELSFLEASKVADLKKMMLTNKTFSSFDEFQYFTSVSQIPNGYFKNCTLMTSIVLPESLRTIFSNAFRGCSSLKQIVIPENVETIVSQTFVDCSDLESVILSSRLETIQQALSIIVQV